MKKKTLNKLYFQHGRRDSQDLLQTRRESRKEGRGRTVEECFQRGDRDQNERGRGWLEGAVRNIQGGERRIFFRFGEGASKSRRERYGQTRFW